MKSMLKAIPTTEISKIRPAADGARFMITAQDIISKVRAEGDSALVELTRKFDWPDMEESDIELDMQLAKEALINLDASVRESLELAAANISRFHISQRQASWSYMDGYGTRLGQRIVPLKSAGIYIPGGSAAYPSTVLMCGLAAKAAGVPNVYMCTPPGKDGSINKATLAAAAIAGVDRIFRIGGAQAIAALAYSTNKVPAVDVIAGPGNAYVTAAKRAVMGDVRVDMLAGPSELMVIADETANPAYIAADLIAQAEHDELACCTLIATSDELPGKVLGELERQLEAAPRREIARRSLESYSACIMAESLEDAIKIADKFAPEHLELCCEGAAALAQEASNAGTIFVGNYSAEAMGDYVAGPSHVLPTMGTARFRGTLSTLDFQKAINVVEYSRDGFMAEGPAAVAIANEEGLFGHASSVSTRLAGSRPAEAKKAAVAVSKPIKLDANECSLDVPAGTKARILGSLMDIPFNRYPSMDSDRLRARLSERFGIEASRFVVGVGSDEMIMVLMLALKGKVDRVVAPWPSFSMYKGISSICGLPFEAIGLGPDGLPDGRELEKALADERALVMLCVPNNPTGDSMEELVRSKIPASKAYVCIDQAYAEFCGSDMSDMASGRTVILRTFSKARRLAGIRVGYSISGKEMADLLRSAKLPYNLPSICEEIAISALDEVEALGDYIDDNSCGRGYLSGSLLKMGLRVRGDSCNFLLIEFDVDEGSRLNARLASMGILTRAFSDRPDLLRVTVGTASENRQFIESLGMALSTIETEKANITGIECEADKAKTTEKEASWD